MEAKAKLLGHPIHQMVIVLPLGLLIAAWIADLAFYLSGTVVLAEVAYWNTVGGIATGLFAAIFGFIDWFAVPVNTRAKRVGAWHAGFNFAVLLLFAASLVLKHTAVGHLPSALSFVCATAGLILGGISGWLGGELVNRLGIGVSPDANVNASSSLKQA
ncbi:MAG TPA: DUF2231 domain-containing protein [Chthoniobacterales bacterium]|jgi:uncharacterized membrane protein|nr:DUF2231 domain-containing protein [Chthoniobacterales bacterium]